MRYGDTTGGIRALFKGNGEGDIDEALLRRLLVQEAEGKPLTTDDVPLGEIFIRLKSPAVMFLSLRRPSVEGLRVLEEVRAMWSFQPPIVVIAPPASSEFKMQMLERGIYTYLEKPIRAGQIKKLVEDILKNQKETVL